MDPEFLLTGNCGMFGREASDSNTDPDGERR